MPPNNRRRTPNRRAALPALLGIPVLLAGAVALIGPRNIWEKIVGGDAGDVDFTAADFAAVLGDRPNIGLAAPVGFFDAALADRVNHVVPDYSAAPEDIFAAVKEAALALPNIRLAEQNFAASTLRLVRYSPTLGFPDTINVRLVERPDGQMSFVALARARVGYSDLGMNAKLLGELIDAVSERLPVQAPQT
ncbi:MAG: DUF1499 domain-containing protein [Pseudomonadota bacterium]